MESRNATSTESLQPRKENYLRRLRKTVFVLGLAILVITLTIVVSTYLFFGGTTLVSERFVVFQAVVSHNSEPREEKTLHEWPDVGGTWTTSDWEESRPVSFSIKIDEPIWQSLRRDITGVGVREDSQDLEYKATLLQDKAIGCTVRLFETAFHDFKVKFTFRSEARPTLLRHQRLDLIIDDAPDWSFEISTRANRYVAFTIAERRIPIGWFVLWRSR